MAGGFLSARPAAALEEGLLGIRIGASYRDVVKRLGNPDGILFSAGGNLMFQTLSPAAPGGLPQFGMQAAGAQVPVWVLPLRTAFLNANQSQWVYDRRTKSGFAVGVVLSGEGADAVVTDVVASGFPENLKNKPQTVRTQRDVVLLSSFADVLRKYGYPPMAEVYIPSAAAAGAAGARAAGGLRGGGAAGGLRGPGAGGGLRGPGAGGGLRGPGAGGGLRGPGAGGGLRGPGAGGGLPGSGRAGGLRGGGAAGGLRAPAAGAGRLPPLGAGSAQQAGGPAPNPLSATAVVDNVVVGFSRDCILTYEGIAFTLHDMRVTRIHVSE